MTDTTSTTPIAGQQLQDAGPLSEQVRRNGYAVPPRDRLVALLGDAALADLGAAFDDLPVDTQIGDVGVYRERRYSLLRVEVDGDTVGIEPLPHAPFRQDSIPIWEGRDRVFEPVPEDVLLGYGLRALVGFDARIATAADGTTSWRVGIHLVRVVARAGVDGQPTPEGRHRDGHSFVGLHLIRREGVTGGLSSVYPNDGGDVLRTTMTRPLDSIFIDDDAVTHEVSPTVADGASGVRDMLQIDFEPVD